jgi:hypothetical protein
VVVPESIKPEHLDGEIEKSRKELVDLQDRIRKMVERREKIRQEALGKTQPRNPETGT